MVKKIKHVTLNRPKRMLATNDDPTRGTEENPYTWEEFTELWFMNEWYGGWVEGQGFISWDLNASDYSDDGSLTSGSGNEENEYGIADWCLYDCMVYLSNKYNCYGLTSQQWANEYRTGNYSTTDSWQGTKKIGDSLYGPLVIIRGADNNLYVNQEIFNFIKSFFIVEGETWSADTAIPALFNNMNTDDTVIAEIMTENNSFHALILTEYFNESEEFGYYDPSGQYNAGNNRLSRHIVLAAVKVIGRRVQ